MVRMYGGSAHKPIADGSKSEKPPQMPIRRSVTPFHRARSTGASVPRRPHPQPTSTGISDEQPRLSTNGNEHACCAVTATLSDGADKDMHASTHALGGWLRSRCACKHPRDDTI